MIPVVDIIAATALDGGISSVEIRSERRLRRIVRPRQRAMYLIRLLRPDVSYPRLVRFLGLADHTTALHGRRRVQARLDAGDPDERAAVERVIQSLTRRAETLRRLDLKASHERIRLLETKVGILEAGIRLAADQAGVLL